MASQSFCPKVVIRLSFHPKAVISLPFHPEMVISLSLRGGFDVLYGGSWGLDCQIGAPEGHSPHGGGDGIHICHPHGLILHNGTGAHCGHSRFNCHFQLKGFWGCLISSHQQWVSQQTGHHFSETQRWCHFLCSFQRPSWQHGLWHCTFNPQMLLHPLVLSPPFPRTLAVRPLF